MDFGSGVLVPDEAELRTYLERFPHIAPLLPKIAADTRAAFGPAADLAFVLNQDPRNEYAELLLRVRLAPYPKDMLKRLEPLWDGVADVLDGSAGWVSVTTDLCPPGWNHGL
jgi:hypothetical protein